MSQSQSSLAELLHLESPPVAIAFVDAPPAGIPRVSASEPAGCGYWRRAAAGEVFFAVADDHKRCPVGAHTHHVVLTGPEREELMGLVTTMVGLSYLKMEDIPKIPRRQTPLQVAVCCRWQGANRARCRPCARQREAVDAFCRKLPSTRE